MKWHPLFFRTLAVSLAVFSTACTKDRTVDDYLRQQAEAEAAKISEIEGPYKGQVISSATGAVVGFATLNLQANKQPTQVQGSTVNQQRAVINGALSIYYLGDSGSNLARASIVINSATTFYNSDTKEFQSLAQLNPTGSATSGTGATAPINNSLGTNLDLRGVFSGDSFSGAIEIVGYESDGAVLNLSRAGGASVDEVKASLADRAQELAMADQEFVGHRVDGGTSPNSTSDTDRAATLRMIWFSKFLGDAALIDLFSPFQLARVILDMKDIVGDQYVYSPVQIDKELHTFQGFGATRSFSGPATATGLSCRELPTAEGWKCLWQLDTSSPEIWEFKRK